MKGYSFALTFLMLFCGALVARAEVEVPPFRSLVVDQTETLSRASQEQLARTLSEYSRQRGTQIAVLIVPTTQPESIEQYSIRVAEQWKIGRKKIDDGILMLVARDDRAVRIEVGYGLEGVLPDVVAKRIIEEVIFPQFRRGDFGGGIGAGVRALIDVTSGEKLPLPAKSGAQQGPNPLVFAILGLGFAAFLSSHLGRVGGSLLSAILFALVLSVVISLAYGLLVAVIIFVFSLFGGSATPYVLSGRSWGGGNSGGGWSGGGGGSFGGGGASGRW